MLTARRLFDGPYQLKSLASVFQSTFSMPSRMMQASGLISKSPSSTNHTRHRCDPWKAGSWTGSPHHRLTDNVTGGIFGRAGFDSSIAGSIRWVGIPWRSSNTLC